MRTTPVFRQERCELFGTEWRAADEGVWAWLPLDPSVRLVGGGTAGSSPYAVFAGLRRFPRAARSSIGWVSHRPTYPTLPACTEIESVGLELKPFGSGVGAEFSAADSVRPRSVLAWITLFLSEAGTGRQVMTPNGASQSTSFHWSVLAAIAIGIVASSASTACSSFPSTVMILKGVIRESATGRGKMALTSMYSKYGNSPVCGDPKKPERAFDEPP